MAPTSTNATSSISLALAGMTESVTIPKPRDANFWVGKESFAAVAAKSLPTKNKTGGLPTPPNSISPSLPPQIYARPESSDPTTPPAIVHLDSDIDLDDAVEHAKAQDSPHRGLTARRLRSLESPDAVGDITPTLLAKHHLPGILLENGPLAIRHVMGYLTTSVPGFSGIPPAKARRIVVAALEGRGSDGQEGSLNSEVRFEKVGWGRWDARKRGQGTRSHCKTAPLGLQIPKSHRPVDRRTCASYASEISYDPHADDSSMPEHEADKMSLDGQVCTSPAIRDHSILHDDLDMTDEEDWASIGAAALRQASYASSPGHLRPSQRRQHSHVDPKSRGRGLSRGRGISKRPSSNFAKSLPIMNHSVFYGKHHPTAKATAGASVVDKESMAFAEVPDVGFGSQDREAVEALLKLSSV